MSINIDSIMGKVAKFAKSPKGQKMIQKVLAEHQKSGQPLANGTIVVGEKEMREASNALIEIIRRHLPESIAVTGASLTSSVPRKLPTGEYECVISFGADAIRRESLETENTDRDPSGHTGEGVNNIVALFNNGYRAQGYAYGDWRGHGITYLFNSPGESFSWVRSRKEREALHFMQEAIAEFNNTYSSKYGATAILGAEYQK